MLRRVSSALLGVQRGREAKEKKKGRQSGGEEAESQRPAAGGGPTGDRQSAVGKNRVSSGADGDQVRAESRVRQAREEPKCQGVLNSLVSTGVPNVLGLSLDLATVAVSVRLTSRDR